MRVEVVRGKEFAMSIGEEIGVIERTFSTRNEAGDKVQISVRFDFSSAPDEVIRDWLVSNRVINLQSSLRKLSVEEIKAYDGKTVICDGSRARTQVDPVAALANKARAEGIDVNNKKELAEFIMKQLSQ